VVVAPVVAMAGRRGRGRWIAGERGAGFNKRRVQS